MCVYIYIYVVISLPLSPLSPYLSPPIRRASFSARLASSCLAASCLELSSPRRASFSTIDKIQIMPETLHIHILCMKGLVLGEAGFEVRL